MRMAHDAAPCRAMDAPIVDRRRPDRARRPPVRDGADAGGAARARAGRAAARRDRVWPGSSCATPATCAIDPGSAPDPDPRAKNRAAICEFLPRERDLVAAALGGRRPGRRAAARSLGGDCTAHAGAMAGCARHGRTPGSRSPGSTPTATSTRPTRRRRATSGGCRSRCSAAAATRTWSPPPTDRRSWSRMRRCSAARSSTRPSRGCSRRRGSPISGPGCWARRPDWPRSTAGPASVASRVDGLYIAFDMDCLDATGRLGADDARAGRAGARDRARGRRDPRGGDPGRRVRGDRRSRSPTATARRRSTRSRGSPRRRSRRG